MRDRSRLSATAEGWLRDCSETPCVVSFVV